MAKESKTQKETKRLIEILGENPTTRFLNFFLGLGIVSVIGTIIFYVTVDKTVGEKGRKSSCRTARNYHLKKVFLSGSNSHSMKEQYEACLPILGTSFAIDSKNYCSRVLKERFLLLGLDVGRNKMRDLNQTISNCGALLESEYASTKTALVDKISNYELKISEHKERLALEKNKALRKEMESWERMKEELNQRLVILNNMSSNTKN